MDGKNKALTPLYIILRFAEVHTSSSSYSNYGCLMLRLVLGYSYGYRENSVEQVTCIFGRTCTLVSEL